MSERKESPDNIIGAPDTWPVAAAGGPLVLVQIRPGAFLKLTESEARRRGLLPPEEKAQPPAPNKARRGARNKAAPVVEPT